MLSSLPSPTPTDTGWLLGDRGSRRKTPFSTIATAIFGIVRPNEMVAGVRLDRYLDRRLTSRRRYDRDRVVLSQGSHGSHPVPGEISNLEIFGRPDNLAGGACPRIPKPNRTIGAAARDPLVIR